jgi:hypothetical protein
MNIVDNTAEHQSINLKVSNDPTKKNTKILCLEIYKLITIGILLRKA